MGCWGGSGCWGNAGNLYLARMKHFCFCLVVVLFSTTMSAQRKVGYINMDDLVAVMPETRQAEKALKAFADSLSRAEGGIQQDFFTKRDAYFQDSATMDATTKEAHRKVLQKIIQQDGEFKAVAKVQLDSMQRVLTVAIVTKAQEGVTAAAKANGYAFVFRKAAGADNQQMFVLIGPEGDDLLPLVKKQLGIDTQ
jgi:outer membrane protein